MNDMQQHLMMMLDELKTTMVNVSSAMNGWWMDTVKVTTT